MLRYMIAVLRVRDHCSICNLQCRYIGRGSRKAKAPGYGPDRAESKATVHGSHPNLDRADLESTSPRSKKAPPDSSQIALV